MKRVLLFAALLLLCSCAMKQYPITGSYPQPPIKAISGEDFESVWTELIDFISEKGFSIKLIDKSSGFLVMDDYNFKNLYTYEKNGKPFDPNAFLVTSSQRAYDKNNRIIPDRIIANMNVRVKSVNNATEIYVNITNIKPYNYEVGRFYSGYVEAKYDVRTTGVFEKMIIDRLRQ